MSDSPATPTMRLVPGAPPPASKSQKKKRKAAKKPSEQAEEPVVVPDAHAAALIDHAPSETDVKEGAVAAELVVRADSTRPVTPAVDEIKLSPIVDMISKRLKTTNKKMIRIQAYSTTPVDKLNDDQIRSRKTLPVLEGVYKELEEVKKAVETHEAELSQELGAKKAEALRAEQQRLADATESAANIHRQKTSDLLSFITLHSALSNGNPAALALGLADNEGLAVFSAIEGLLGTDAAKKAELLNGFWTGEGEFQGIPYSQFMDFTHRFLNPRSPSPPPEQPAVSVEFIPTESAAPEPAVGGLPLIISTTSSFQFVQDDELEAEVEAQEQEQEQHNEVEVDETITEVTINGHTVIEDTVTITTTTEVPQDSEANQAGLNWADEDDGGLPSIASLHDKFGSSATGTPAPEQESLPATPSAEHGAPEDGFHSTNRGRGRGRGGYRGGERGGYHGGERGGFRGFRGERGGRGGDRGGRGFRGGDRGGRRSSEDWRGGDVEHRSRGGEGEHRPRGGDGEHRPRGGDGEHRPRGGDGEHRPRGGDGEYRPRGGDGEYRPRGGDGEHRPRGRGRGRGRGHFHSESRGGAPVPAS